MPVVQSPELQRRKISQDETQRIKTLTEEIRMWDSKMVQGITVDFVFA